MIYKTDNPQTSAPCFKSRYAILLLVLASAFMSVLDSNVVSTALPVITRFFDASLATSQWVITAYLITGTALMLFFGKLAGYVGKNVVFTAGIAVFTVSSLACGLSAGMGMLIAFRVVQAVGAAMIFSLSFALLMEAFPRNEWGRAAGLNAATVAIGMLVGPVVGGFVTDWLGWQYIFFINVPIGAVLLAGCLVYLKNGAKPEPGFRMDWAGSALFAVLMASLTLLLREFSGSPYVTAAVLAYAGLLLLSAAAFVLWESRCRDPLLDLSVFQVKGFTLPLASMVLYFAATLILSVVSPFYYQLVLGYSATQSGALSLVPMVVMAVGAPLSGMLYDKSRGKNLALPGMAVMGLAFVACGFLYGGMAIVPVMASVVLVGAGAALFQSANNADIMGALPEAKADTVSSILATARNLGMALGSALASILVSYQLAGTGGEVLHAGASVLAEVFGNDMYFAGAMCFLGAILYLGVRSRPGQNINAPGNTIQEMHAK